MERDCSLHEKKSNLLKRESEAYPRTYNVPLCCTRGAREKEDTEGEDGDNIEQLLRKRA